MNKLARDELQQLMTELRNMMAAIEASSPLNAIGLEQVDDINQLVQMLVGLEIGIDRALNETQSSLATIADFLTSPRCRNHPNTD